MKRLILLLLLIFTAGAAAETAVPARDSYWYELHADGSVQLKLWFFWSERCPHCLEARPVIERMADEHPWLLLRSRELVNSMENRESYREMARRFDREARSVPAFFFCNTMMVGFDDAATTGAYLLEELQACRRKIAAGQGLDAKTGPEQAALTQATGIDMDGMSMPLITLVIAGLDAFNPCAFFVLLFLLSLMIHLRNRKRMLLVGGVFVLISGVVYFLFMAAWLNVFLLLGALRWVTTAAGLIALTMAVLNIKDYFTSAGVSLSMSVHARSGLFQRMRGLLNAENLPAMLTGTVVLAVIANSYELLCTSGLPMVYTRLLTLEALPLPVYYLYLAAYNVIYVLPLFAIVVVFAITLGSRKLQVNEVRALKLMSGLMMLGLGLVLVFAPDRLGNLLVALGIIAAAIGITAAAFLFEQKRGSGA